MYILNLDEHKSIGTHSVALHVNDNTTTYLDSFEAEHITKKMKTFIGNNNIIVNFHRMQPMTQLYVETIALELLILC